MASRRMLQSREFNEYVYCICSSLSESQVKSLSIPHRWILSTNARLRSFCFHSSIDEKIMFLSDIGIKYSVSFYPETAKEKKDLSEIMKKYSKGAMASATDDLASEKVFVFTDKEVAFNAGLIAQSTNTKSYILSLNYNRVSRNIKNTASDLDASLQNKIGEVTESFNYTTRVFFMAMLLCENSLENYGLLKYDLLVLFFYFINKHIFVAKEKVLDFFQYYLPTKNRAGAAVHTLYKSGFVKLGDVSEKERHTITTKGINLIMQYCRDVTKESII